MKETIIIALLALITLVLYNAARKQRKKARQIRRKIIDRVWRRNEID